MGESRKRPAQDIGWALHPLLEEIGELVFRRLLFAWLSEVPFRVVQNDMHPSLLRQSQQDLYDVGFIEIISEHLERERRIVEHTVDHIEDSLARGLTHPVVDLRKSKRLPVVGAGLCVGIEIEILGLGNDWRIFPEMADIRFRLHVSPGESELKRAFFERSDTHFDRDAKRGVQSLHRTIGVEVARSDRVGVFAKRWRHSLMSGARVMGPAEFLDRSIDCRGRFLAGDLSVFAGVLELKFVLQIVSRHLSGRLAEDRKTRKIFCLVPNREVEGEQGLLVTNIAFNRKGVLALSYERHGVDLVKSGSVPGIGEIATLQTSGPNSSR